METQLDSKVRHKDGTINNGLMMMVEDIEEEKQEVLCVLNDGTKKWFNEKDFDVITQPEGGFRNEGE